MKKILNILSILFLIVLFSSCSDFLDKTPDEDMTLEDVFASESFTANYVSNIYSCIPTEANFADRGSRYRNPFVGGCDEMEIAYGGAFSHRINSGSWDPNTVWRIPIWSQSYIAIRKVNILLEHVKSIPADPTQKKLWEGEAYFLRAYFHFLAFRAYGPIILLDRSLTFEDDLLAYTRRPVDECVEFIAADCDKAAALLPDKMENVFIGRASRVAALALKSRVLLYGASPLYNGNSDFAEFRDSTGLQFFSQTYDSEKWGIAATAAKECIEAAEAAGYQLHKSVTNDPVESYEEIFLENWNKEILFAKNLDRYGKHFRCADPISASGYSIINPTQEMVDAYEMENGLAPILGYTDDGLTPIINPASGYVEEGYVAVGEGKENRYPEGVRNMFAKREARFYASINYPGQIWKKKELQFWYNGRDGKRYAGSDYCKTGYLMRKFMNENNRSKKPYIVEQCTWVIARLAEIYLNYAEALNEKSGPTSEVYKYVNIVRERVDLPGLPAGLTKEEMRKKIKHERRIELAFETHRFFDVRRWKDAVVSESKPIHSLNIRAGKNRQDDAFYERRKVEDRIFESPKHYFFPLKQSEIDKNTDNLMQNFGW